MLTYAYIFGILAIIWSLYWKIRGLWNTARDGNKLWFGLIFFINSLGILPIVYLYLIRK